MKIKSVKIGGLSVPVESCDDLSIEDEGRWAQYDYRREAITISTSQRPEGAIAESLIHEILHGLFWNSGVRARESWDKDLEEMVVEALSPRLTAFFRDNPDTVRELLRMLR